MTLNFVLTDLGADPKHEAAGAGHERVPGGELGHTHRRTAGYARDRDPCMIIMIRTQRQQSVTVTVHFFKHARAGGLLYSEVHHTT